MALLTGEELLGGRVVDADKRQVVAVEGVGGGVVGTQVTANALAGGAGTLTAGATAQLVAANASRKGLQVTVDSSAATNVYFLLGAGSASATNFHFALGQGGSWNGLVGNVLWTGAVQFFSSGTPKVGVAEV